MLREYGWVKLAPHIRYGESLIFAFGGAVLCHMFTHEPDSLAYLSRTAMSSLRISVDDAEERRMGMMGVDEWMTAMTS